MREVRTTINFDFLIKKHFGYVALLALQINSVPFFAFKSHKKRTELIYKPNNFRLQKLKRLHYFHSCTKL